MSSSCGLEGRRRRGLWQCGPSVRRSVSLARSLACLSADGRAREPPPPPHLVFICVTSRAACLPSMYPQSAHCGWHCDDAAPVSIELIKWPMEERNPVADDEGRQVCGKTGREREREKGQAPHPSDCSANYYTKILEILATHDQLFWPTL